MVKLQRYSKERGAGDQTSGGRGKLLRTTTNLDNIDLVVRETLQNSWDARLEGADPTYGIRIYKCDDQVKSVLRNKVFTDLPSSLEDLSESLSLSDLHIIEIFDRGTTGLDGPFHPSREAQAGASNNFNSFVFDIGTTKAVGGTGGTFGFGKTAAFEVSSVHSLVYWSVCSDGKEGLEDRLIASSLHEPYNERGRRFTGAHWWGDLDDNEIVPLRGDSARNLGSSLFRTKFKENETGTSILIIDPIIRIKSDQDAAAQAVPVRSRDHAEALRKHLSSSMAENAWPKTVPVDDGVVPMNLHLFSNNIEQNISDTAQKSYTPYAYSLSKVREKQGEGEHEIPFDRIIIEEEIFPIRLRPNDSVYPKEDYFGTRTDQTTGHLHLMKCVKFDNTESNHKVPFNQLCLMRSKVELVVTYDEILDFEDELLEWYGVFKPTPECDHHFAASEPATHDSWVANSTRNEVSTYVVEKTLQNIRRKTREFLRDGKQGDSKEVYSVRNVSLALSSFTPYGELPELEMHKSKKSASRGSRRNRIKQPSVELLSHETLSEGLGQLLNIRAESDHGSQLKTRAQVFASTLQDRMKLDSEECEIKWTIDGTVLNDTEYALLPIGKSAQLEIRTLVATAIEVQFTVEDVI